MSDCKLKPTRFAIILAAAIAISNPALADEGEAPMPKHQLPFVSGVTSTRQSSGSSNRRSSLRSPHREDVGKPWNIFDYIKDINNVQEATVVLFPPGWESPILLNERQIKNSGCATRDPSRIARLIDLLQRSGLRTAHPPIPASDSWEGIFLTLANGDEISVWLAFPVQAAPSVMGSFRGFHGRKQYLVASPSLPKDLYLWAEKTGESGRGNAECRQWTQEAIENLFKDVEPK